MSKNLTRKGLAFGALVALGASVIAGAPANAAGMTDKTFVSLTPLTGTEYTVLSDQFIDLKASASSTISGTNNKDIKFLITDPSKVLRADAATTTKSASLVNAVNTSVTASGGSASTASTLTWAGTTVVSGEKYVAFGSSATAVNGVLYTASSTTAAAGTSDAVNITAGALTLGSGTTLANTVGLAPRAALISLPQAGIGRLLEESSIASTYGPSSTALTNNRFANGSFVINSETDDIGLSRALRLVTTDASSSYSFTVTAWSDDNDDNIIDATEFTSEVRTVNFQKASDLAVTTSMTPIVGDKSLTATVSTTPVLNGEQVIAQSGTFLNVGFTRQGSTVAPMYGPTASSATSAWDDDTKLFTVAAGLDVAANGTTTNANVSTAAASQVNGAWLGLAAPNATPASTEIGVSTSGLVTVTMAAHGLVSGDKVTMAVNTAVDTTIGIAVETVARTVTVVSSSQFTYQVSETTGLPTAALLDSTLDAGTEFVVATYSDAPAYTNGRVFAGTYTAQAYVSAAAIGNKVTATTATATSSEAKISTVASASVQGKYFTVAGSNTTYVKTGTLTVPVTISVTDSAGSAVSAGRPVVLTLTASGTSETFKVNGKTDTDTLYTDANGAVSATITSVAGVKNSILEVAAVSEGVATTDIDLSWADQAFSLVDLSVTDGAWVAGGSNEATRSIAEKGSYSLELAVMDQWFTVPAADVYRLKVVGEGVPQAFVPLTAGKASVKITDSTVEGSTLDTDVILQKMSGATVLSETTFDVATNLVAASKVLVGADGSTIYSSTAVDVASPVAAKALVELDKRTSTTLVPTYTNYVSLSGQVVNAATNAGLQGAVVTVTGASSILFVDTATSNVYKRGSLTFVSNTASGADAGKWEVLAYSTTGQTDAVVTITANGVSNTAKVTFTGSGVGDGTALVVTAPATALPASTFQISAKLADTYGNGVTAAAGRVKVTHSGPGIVYGTLPTSTDANGALSFSVLLGAADVGNAVFTVSYDQNGDGDFVDAKDLTSAKTVVIGSASVLDVSASVAGTPGFVAVTVRNASGKAVTVTVNGRVLTPRAPNVAAQFYRFRAKAGKTTVVVKVDGVTVASRTVMVK